MAKSENKYLPSHKRVTNPPPMRLTDRDIRIVIADYLYRLLSSQQIEALFFPSTGSKPHSRRSACQRRLQLLYHHGFLERIPRPLVMGEGRAPFVYALDSAGADLVANHLEVDRAQLSWKPKDNEVKTLFLEHRLAINDFRVAVTNLAKQQKWKVSRWIDDRMFRSEALKDKVPSRVTGASIARNYPDGYFSLILGKDGPPAHFFLEIDRGTMSNSRWKRKIVAYNNFRHSRASKRHYGTENFRVLTVTTSENRLLNLKETTDEAGGKDFFWFTSEDNISIWHPESLLEPIWQVAGHGGSHLAFS